jgi:hypothetical protein
MNSSPDTNPADSPSSNLRCSACGRSFAAPELPPGARIVCPRCGSLLDQSAGKDSASSDQYLMSAGTTDDDGQAYGVFGEKPGPVCPSCHRPMPDDAEACSHCNWNRAAGRVLPKVHAPFSQTWEAGWSFHVRFAVFLACQLLNAATALLLLWKRGALPTTVGGWFAASALQAFVLGTFDRLTLARTSKGKVTLTKSWRVCFVPLTSQTIQWRDFEGIVVQRRNAGLMEWLMLLMLVPGIILPIVWWWCVIRPGQVIVALTQNLGDPVCRLYSGANEDRAEEIAQTVRDLTHLPCELYG